MAEWVYVENNQIKEYHSSLPKSWRNISGLDKANVNYLTTLGWFKIEKNHDLFDEKTHKSDGYEYQIFDDRVVETIKIVPLSTQEILLNDARKREEFFEYLRGERNRRLSESDWTQLADVYRSQEWKNNWEDYRQQLRDLPSLYQENNTDVDFNSIAWPTKPSQE